MEYMYNYKLYKQHMYNTYFFDILYYYFSGSSENPCEGITFGGCLLRRSSIIKNGTQADAVTCQEACRYQIGCEFFRYSDQFNSKCTLLSDDYRMDCDIIGGSLVCTQLRISFTNISRTYIVV